MTAPDPLVVPKKERGGRHPFRPRGLITLTAALLGVVLVALTVIAAPFALLVQWWPIAAGVFFVVTLPVVVSVAVAVTASWGPEPQERDE